MSYLSGLRLWLRCKWYGHVRDWRTMTCWRCGRADPVEGRQ